MQPFAGVRGAGTGFNLLGVTGLLVKSEWLGERSGFGADASSSHIFFFWSGQVADERQEMSCFRWCERKGRAAVDCSYYLIHYRDHHGKVHGCSVVRMSGSE